MADQQVERWCASPGRVPVDALAGMTKTTFDIIVEAMLGGAATLNAECYSCALTENFNTIPWHILFSVFSVPEWMPFPGQRRALKARDFLHRDIGRIVSARRAKPSARPDLLNLLLTARDPETDRGMTDSEVVWPTSSPS